MQTRYIYLDGLRGIAALIVVLVHGIIAFDFALYTGLSENSLTNWDIPISAYPFLLPMAGNYSVCVFFVLSGFVLSHSFGNTRLGSLALIVKRYIRLTLPIVAACLLGWAVVRAGLAFNASAEIYSKSSWLGVQTVRVPDLAAAILDSVYGVTLGVPGAAEYDGALWTMPIEFMGSILLILLFAVAGSLRARPLGMATIFLILASISARFYLSLFAVGAVLYFLNLSSRLWVRRYGLPFTLILLLGIFFGTVPYSAARGHLFAFLIAHSPYTSQQAWQQNHPAWLGAINEAFWHGIGAILTLVAVECLPPLQRLLSTPVPQFLGRISFPLYLLHLPILISLGCGLYLVLIHHGFGLALSSIIAIVVFYCAAITVAALATQLIEVRAVLWSNKAALLIQRWVHLSAPRSRFLPGNGKT